MISLKGFYQGKKLTQDEDTPIQLKIIVSNKIKGGSIGDRRIACRASWWPLREVPCCGHLIIVGSLKCN